MTSGSRFPSRSPLMLVDILGSLSVTLLPMRLSHIPGPTTQSKKTQFSGDIQMGSAPTYCGPDAATNLIGSGETGRSALIHDKLLNRRGFAETDGSPARLGNMTVRPRKGSDPSTFSKSDAYILVSDAFLSRIIAQRSGQALPFQSKLRTRKKGPMETTKPITSQARVMALRGGSRLWPGSAYLDSDLFNEHASKYPCA
ncbi:hypothetical protein B0H15DRAFT_183674 [Mycena belliarum]|uniref:Uncharacterized protein n=1 Tax=Mycena belliarum TaxID=1033014 RepID=A0AAD6UB69_9AGAR|nr:hypothetical protein B0H15DRAFT_183674 [Mycena belliae]